MAFVMLTKCSYSTWSLEKIHQVLLVVFEIIAIIIFTILTLYSSFYAPQSELVAP
jgi:hypothetical protein